MRASFADEKILREIRGSYEKVAADRLKYGYKVSDHAETALKALDIIKNDDIKTVQDVYTYEHHCTVVMFPYHPCPQNQNCKQCGIEWLQQPAEEVGKHE